jgi:hypothetical protein
MAKMITRLPNFFYVNLELKSDQFAVEDSEIHRRMG